MSAITDVGVNFKFNGADNFESRLKSLETQWKSFSGSFNQAPEFNKHFEKIGASAEHASKRISSAMAVTKAAILGVLTAKAGAGIFDWAIGNKGIAEAKSFTSQFVDPNDLKVYEKAMSKIRNEHDISKADLYKGAYQIDSAMAGKPLEDKIKVFEQMAYWAKLTGKSFEDASKLYKQFLASFGNTQPMEKQKTFASDTLGMLFKIGQISSSDPQQVADAVGQAGQTYAQLGLTQARMFAEISAMTPMLGGKPEMAATGLRSLYPEAGTAAGKLAAAAYEQAFAKGQVSDNMGRTSRNWGSLRNLEIADKEGNKQAKKDLAEMKRNSKQFADDTAAEIQKMLDNKDIEGLWKRLGQLVDQNKSNPQSSKILKDAFGLERMNIALGLIGAYRRGEIQNLTKEYEKATGQEAIDARRKADENSLPHKMELLTQKAEDLSNTVRGIFYDPMSALLEEWKAVFQKIEKDFTGKGGTEKLKGFGGALVTGTREGYNQGQPIPEDNRSLGQIFQDFVATLSVEDFRSAGQKIGKAASDFAQIMGQLKQIIGALASAISWLTEGHKAGAVAGLWAASKTPGPWWLKGAVGAGVGVGVDALTGEPNENILGIPGSHYVKKGINEMITGPEAPSVQSSRESQMYSRPNDNMQSAHEASGRGPLTIIQRHENVVQIDGKEIAREVAPEVKEIIEADQDRNRSNANDDGIKR